tara:strand:+ start:1416 stop:1607 length:192 start_codon:yes stop_codon:yes gene_type:complete
VEHKVSKHELDAPFHTVEGQEYPETNKEISTIKIIGIRLTHTFPESKISPQHLIIEEVRHSPE